MTREDKPYRPKPGFIAGVDLIGYRQQNGGIVIGNDASGDRMPTGIQYWWGGGDLSIGGHL